MTRWITLCAIVTMTAGLSACGKVGRLERPGPLFGSDRTAAKPGDHTMPRQDPNRPVDTVDPRDRSTDAAPPRTLPITGTSPSPTQPAPQGVLPDPYANPARR